jgi:hypothetical protein
MLVLEKWNKEVLPKLVKEVELAGEPGLKIRFVVRVTVAQIRSLSTATQRPQLVDPI